MKSLIALVAVIAFAVIALSVLRARLTSKSDGAWPFHARKPLSAPEQVLYFRLIKALPDHIVLAQVGLTRILGVDRGHNGQAWRNRINRMSADFVVCAKDASVMAVIELDDSSHKRPDRTLADTKKDRALDAAGIRVIRWQVNSLPNEAAIRHSLLQASRRSDGGHLAARNGRLEPT